MKTSILIVLSITFAYSSVFASERYHVKEGIKKYQKNEYMEAKKSFEAAKKEQPNNPIINYDIGNTLYKQGEFEKAKNEYGKALITKDKKLKQKVFYNLGNAAFKDNNFDEAVEYYKKALDLNPKDINSKYNLEFTKMIKASPQKKKQQCDKNCKEKEEKQKKAKAQKKEGDEGEDKKKGREEKESDEKGEDKQEQKSGDEEKKEMSKEDAERLLQYYKDAEKDAAKQKKMKNPKLPQVEQDW